MHRLILCSLFLLLFINTAHTADAWLKKISPEHPRLFINNDIRETLIKNALGPCADHYKDIKFNANRMLKRDDIQFHVYECSLPGLMVCYYVEKDQKYKDKALWVLRTGSKHLGSMFKAKKPVSWFSFARISLMMGYDWLYHDLSADERQSIAQDIIENVRVLNDPKSPKVKRENYFGFPGGGFYGVRNLKWYAGLTFHGEGVNDKLCIQWMKEGLADFKQVADYRKKSGGDDGGMSAVVLGYVFGAYPRCEWNLIHTWRSALGENIAADYSYVANITNWIAWRTIIGKDNQMYGYGPGDAHHNTNKTGYSNSHLAQIQYFFSDSHPQQSQLAGTISSLNSNKKIGGYHFEDLYALLLDWEMLNKQKQTKPYRLDETWAHARHFEYLGQFFMRSGFNPEDTYCLFTAGNQGAGHGHFDELNFTIYKKGFLALDSGTRDQAGGPSGVQHNTEYYNRSIAHNTLLIKMPGEKFPHHWGNVPKHNDGGQNKAHGTKIRAFSTNEHYSYVNADASPVYSSKKANLVNRQFCYIYPNHFVIIDRVNSTEAEFPKTWLLHTQNEPQLSDGIMSATHQDGIMHCKTLWPKDAQQKLIGGPGKTSWVDGKDFPVTKKYIDVAKKKFKGPAKEFELLTGNWRLEVSPAQAQTDDLFVHVIEVGDKGELKQMHTASIDDKGKELQIDIDLGDGRSAKLSVDKSDPVKGSIVISKGIKTLCDEKLSTSVQAQSTVSGK